MKTSLGIWAFGPMVTRFVPGGYQPTHGYDPEPVAEKVHRAVQGLGELIDGYEFHYPGELSPDNLEEVRSALEGHDVYCIATGLHVDPRDLAVVDADRKQPVATAQACIEEIHVGLGVRRRQRAA